MIRKLVGFVLLMLIFRGSSSIVLDLFYFLTDTVKITAVEEEMRGIYQVYQNYRTMNDMQYPPPEKRQEFFTNNFIKPELLLDPWDNTYSVKEIPDDNGPQIICKGPDGILNTSDDIIFP